MTQLDVRPGRLDLLFRPGNAIILELTWPAGTLSGTHTAVLGDQDLDVVVVGDVMTITADDSITEDIEAGTRWSLTRVADDEVIITGFAAPSLMGTDSPDAASVVVLEDVSVAVTVLGGGGVSDHGAMTGLADDDHPQYTTTAEVATAVSDHAGEANPHPTYLTAAEGSAAYDALGAAAAAQAASQPVDSDLTAIAALSTTAYGRALLALADAAALRTAAALVLGTDIYSKAAVDSGFQPLDSDLTAIAALSTTTFGRSLLTPADAAAARTTLGITAAPPAISLIASGSYHPPPGVRGTGAGWTAPGSFGFLSAIPFYVPAAFTATSLAVYGIGTGAGALIRLGIYADNGNMRPGSLIIDAGYTTVDGTTGGTKEVTAFSQALSPGIVWLATRVSVANATLGVTTTSAIPIPGTQAQNLNNVKIVGVADAGSGSGALPGTFVTAFTQDTIPLVLVKAA